MENLEKREERVISKFCASTKYFISNYTNIFESGKNGIDGDKGRNFMLMMLSFD